MPAYAQHKYVHRSSSVEILEWKLSLLCTKHTSLMCKPWIAFIAVQLGKIIGSVIFMDTMKHWKPLIGGSNISTVMYVSSCRVKLFTLHLPSGFFIVISLRDMLQCWRYMGMDKKNSSL